MRSYQSGKIYSLRSHSTASVYIGSTIETLARRMAGHRSQYKSYLNGKDIFYTSFEILKYNDAYIELIEDCPCETKAQLERREGQIMRETANYINKTIAGRTEKERYEANKEHLKEYNKNNYEANKEKMKEQNKQYREANKEKIEEKRSQKYTCECGSVVRKDSKPRHIKTKKHQNFINK